MTWSVYQHWDPLRVCVVGRSYPPEFYSWITVPHVRSLFEKIAIETEEDYQNIIKKLESFGVEVLRPNLPQVTFENGKYVKPPMTPRDYTVMIGDTFYYNDTTTHTPDFAQIYKNIKAPNWPKCTSIDDFKLLPQYIQDECHSIHNIDQHTRTHEVSLYGKGCYDQIYQKITDQGNTLKQNINPLINGSMVSRIGRDLYFGTDSYDEDTVESRRTLNYEFFDQRIHIVNTGGHSDGTYCPVAPGLIISLKDVPTYRKTFPGWEVVYLPGQSWAKVPKWNHLKQKNGGRWWVPGFEDNIDVIHTVETWLTHWVGYVEETVFDVNMLIIDPKNVIVFSYNKQVFDALERYGITPHIVPFRHRYFWDGGIHCVTSDLHREGTMQDFFPERDRV